MKVSNEEKVKKKIGYAKLYVKPCKILSERENRHYIF